MAQTLGFGSVILSQGYNISPNIVKILTVNSILVNCNVIGNSYLNSKQFPVLYSFFPNVKPGYKVVQDPVNVVYLPINGDQIQNIRGGNSPPTICPIFTKLCAPHLIK